VTGGQTTNVVAFLPRQTVRYTFTVVPTTIEDRYSFTVESTFETQVPTPVVTISPASLDLSQYPGTEVQVQFTVANHGLIAAEHVQLDIPSTADLEVTPLITEIGRLAPNTSLTIPVLVRRLSGGGGVAAAGLSGDAGLGAAGFGDGQCSVTAKMLWDYLCGPNVVNKDTAFYMFDSTGCDLVDLYFQVYELVPENPGPGPVITTEEFVDYLNQFQPVDGFEAPPGYKFQCRETPPAGSPLLAQNVSVQRLAGWGGIASSSPAAAGNEVCARVQLRLDQRAVLARDAFRATLEILNETGDPLENILVSLAIQDGTGALVNSLFGIRPPELSGMSGVDGTGMLPASTTGQATWILIPTLDAAPTNGSQLYLVGGTLTYEQAGTTVTIPLAPAPIQVFPQPELLVRYFHERDVFSDDPFTPQIEPSVPYSLAVQVNNVGYGAARSLKLTGGQPQVVDNEKGLLIEFKAIATQLENQSLTPALEVDFGRIEPSSNKVARWLFTSALQGNFTNFSASFAHLDALGAQRLSLIRAVEIHELTRIVQAGGSFEDGRPDLLVNDVPDVDRFPDTLYLSNGTLAPVTAVSSAMVNGSVDPSNLTVTVSATAPAGWTYLRFGNPGGADFRLVQVQRANGSIIPLGTNVWTTDRIFPGGEIRPIYTNLIHLLDHDIAGSYTLTFAPIALLSDTNPPASIVSALSSNSPPDFPVQWSGDDGTNGSGVAHFDVYVSINGGAYTPWVTNTPLTSAIYNGAAGNTYAFYSRATDVAGNTEAAPGAFDARTFTISVVNSAPAFSAVGTQSVSENTTFVFTPNVTDSDVPAQTLTFSLLPGAPAGALLSPTTGRITWSTSESDGGSTHTLRIVATDNGSPSLSATQNVVVQVSEINSAPVIAGAPGQVTFNEDMSSAIILSANDADLPAQTLTWQFVGVVPSGIIIDPNTGLITWMPTETQGPGTNTVTVIVRDNGTPNLSDSRTISIIVNEVNRPPVMAAIPDQVASVLSTLTLTALATDPDVPTNRLTFTLDPGAPAGARIFRNGVFSWTPSRSQALSTNPITVRVTDNGLPALSHTRTFNVVIGHYFDVALGSAFVLGGQTGSVDITVTATRPVTNASFTVDVPVPGLGNFTLPPPVPPLASATVQQIAPTQYQIDLQTLNGQVLSGLQTISSLQFVAATNQPSAFVPLLVSGVSANQTDGSPLVPAVGADGRVIYINGAPLLEMGTNRVQLRVTIYAEPGPDYALESAPSLMPGAVWTEIWSGPISNSLQVILPPHTNAAGFYRAVRP
jgi:hypothetical protein